MSYICLFPVVPVILSVFPMANQTSYVVNETERVVFECSAVGIPAPTITWYRDGVEVMDNRVVIPEPMSMDYVRMDGQTVVRVTRILQFEDTADADSGTYTCNATNNAGEDEMEFELVVQSK